MTDRERFEDLKYAYALGALPEEERRWLESYLTEHPELQSEVDDLLATASLLAFSPAEREPPAELRKNLLRDIRDELPVHARQPAPSLWERMRGLLTTPRLAAAASVLAVSGLLAWNITLQREMDSLSGTLAERQTHVMQASAPAGNAQAQVVELGDGRAMLIAENLPDISEEETYETWIIHGETPRPAGTFRPSEGSAAASIQGHTEGADAIAVTVEPAGGSPTPTGEIMLQTEL